MHRNFPAVVIVARYGRHSALVLAIVVATGLLGSGLLPSAMAGWLSAAGIGIVTWAVLRLVSEVVEVVADTLLPR